jgi:ATP-dependent Clp protease ATP-binding subunit ClpB
MEIESQPTELDQIERKILQLQIEKQSLSKESDSASKERLEKLEKELSELCNTRDVMKMQWQNEKNSIDLGRKLKEELETARFNQEKYTREGNLEKAAELKYSIIPELEKQLQDAEKKEAENDSSSSSLLRQAVTEEDIAKVVSSWTGIPVSKMMAGEKQKYLELENVLHNPAPVYYQLGHPIH